ncbi:MAG: hypothetical protein A2V90_06650 [Gammaproteobacteria bacterium RBG_16_57_12]|nr:MAG: hypothetical protein A2V90_06650 [Gammaproteobacteria bacterium RBG_16_57_12]
MTTTNQHSITILNSHEKESFLIHSKFERLRILRDILDTRTSITAFFPDLHGSFITILLGINRDKESIEFDSTRNPALNKKILGEAQLICATTHNNVKVEFIIDQPCWLTNEQDGVFTSALPKTMIRLQRRESFRVPVPSHLTIRCNLPSGEQKLVLAVHDISAGGIGARVTGIDLAVGTLYKSCEITLPNTSGFQLDLEVRNCRLLHGQKESAIRHIGLAFVNVPGTVMAQIQKYIFILERDSAVG